MRSVLKNKRGGDLVGPEFIKFIIAAIVIFFLIYLGARLIGIFVADSEYETAKLTVEEISKLANSMSEGDTKTYLVEGPRDWQMFTDQQNTNYLCLCAVASCEENRICQNIGLPVDINPGYDKLEKFKNSLAGVDNVEVVNPEEVTVSKQIISLSNLPLALNISKVTENMYSYDLEGGSTTYSNKKLVISDSKDVPLDQIEEIFNSLRQESLGYYN